MKKIIFTIFIFLPFLLPSIAKAGYVDDALTIQKYTSGAFLIEALDPGVGLAVKATWCATTKATIASESAALSSVQSGYDYCKTQTKICAGGYCLDKGDIVPGCGSLIAGYELLKNKILLDNKVRNAVGCENPAGDAGKATSIEAGTSKKTEPLTAGSEITLKDPLAGATILTLIQKLIGVVIPMSGAIALLVFIYGGVMWMTAGGSNRVDEAKKIIEYGSIGLVIILFAYTLSSTFIKLIAG